MFNSSKVVLFVMLSALLIVTPLRGGESEWTTETHGFSVPPVENLIIQAPDGREMIINLTGETLDIHGDLPASEAAEIFFEALLEISSRKGWRRIKVDCPHGYFPGTVKEVEIKEHEDVQP